MPGVWGFSTFLAGLPVLRGLPYPDERQAGTGSLSEFEPYHFGLLFFFSFSFWSLLTEPQIFATCFGW